MKRTILVVALVLASPAHSDEVSNVEAVKAIWRTEICEPRSRVYRDIRTILEKGVPLDEAVGRAAPLEDKQDRIGMENIGVSSYVDAVHAIYKSRDPTAMVQQLDQECMDVGDYKKPKRPEVRAVNCSRVQGAALREKHDQLPQLEQRCLEIRQAAIEASSDIEFRIQVNHRADKAEKEGWEDGMSVDKLRKEVSYWLAAPVQLPQPMAAGAAPGKEKPPFPTLSLLVVGGTVAFLFLVVILLRRKG